MDALSLGTPFAKSVTTTVSAVWYHSCLILFDGVCTPSSLVSAADGFASSGLTSDFAPFCSVDFSVFLPVLSLGSSASGVSFTVTFARSSPSSTPLSFPSTLIPHICRLFSFSSSFLTHLKHSLASAQRSKPNSAIPLLSCACAMSSLLPRFEAKVTAISASCRAELGSGGEIRV